MTDTGKKNYYICIFNFETEKRNNLKVHICLYVRIYASVFIIYICVCIFTFFYHTTCESTCDSLHLLAAPRVDNTISVAQDSTATPRATMQLFVKIYACVHNTYVCVCVFSHIYICAWCVCVCLYIYICVCVSCW